MADDLQHRHPRPSSLEPRGIELATSRGTVALEPYLRGCRVRPGTLVDSADKGDAVRRDPARCSRRSKPARDRGPCKHLLAVRLAAARRPSAAA